MARNTIQPGRFTAQVEGDFVVFLIGIRINYLWRIHQWWRPFMAMPRMLRELERHPEKGLLGWRLTRSGRTVTVIQYWNSTDHLEAFAKNSDDPHLPAWREFNRRVGSSGTVGVFHETFRANPGSYESIYVNMPVMGLAAAGTSVPVTTGSNTARQRLGDGVQAAISDAAATTAPSACPMSGAPAASA